MNNALKNKLVPKLRFSEFISDGEWFDEPLNSVAEIINERAGANEYITMSVTPGLGLISQKAKFGREIAGAQYKNYYVIKKWDFAYNKSATKYYPEGYITILKDVNEAAVPNSIFTCFRTDMDIIYPPFLDYVFQNNFHGKWIRKYIEVGGRAHGLLSIDTDVLMNMPIIYPKLKEQQKIADCLSSFDDLINAETQQLETLKVHKKGLMQNLFPKEGENVPELRFPEFLNEDVWEAKRLGKILKSESSQIALNKLEFVNEGYPVYGASGFVGNIDFFMQDEDYIAIVKDGSGVGNLFLYSKETSVLGTLTYLKTRDEKKYSLVWLYYLLSTINFDFYIKGSGIPHIYYSDYETQLVLVPKKIKEQQKIADCLSSLDELITAQSEKIENLSLHKKGLMQDLFPNFNGENF